MVFGREGAYLLTILGADQEEVSLVVGDYYTLGDQRWSRYYGVIGLEGARPNWQSCIGVDGV